MKRPNVFFRVDASAEIGMGHLVRCIALGLMLKNDFDISFVCNIIPESSINEIKKLGFNLIVIENEKDFFSLLKKDVIVVLDHYGLGSSYQKNIKDISCKLICIDDLHDKVFFADLIINPAPNITSSDYNASMHTQYALGLDYVLLRPAFLNKAHTQLINKSIKTAFICFGGADPENITKIVANILKTDARFEKIIVVVGVAYNYVNELKQTIKNDIRFILYHSADEDTMATLLSEADLAIVPSSGILQEALAIGTRIISGIYIENQKHVFKNYKALNAFESAENFSEIDLSRAINASFEKQHLLRKNLIDGKSAERLLNVFIQLTNEDSVVLRRIKEDDLDKTFEWASNSEMRKYSFNSNPVEYHVHKNWFINKVNDKNCFYYLGELNNEIFGSIRFDIHETEAKISYLIDPDYQNKSLGTILLKKGLTLFLQQLHKKVLIVWGEVFHENLASVKVFMKLGYTIEANTETNIIKFKKVINLTLGHVPHKVDTI